jgi:hypothetical protein
MSLVHSFLLRISQKFINIIVAKTLLYRELPKARDFTYFLLLIIHFLVFALYHRALGLIFKERNERVKQVKKQQDLCGEQVAKSYNAMMKEETLINKFRRNKCRVLVQETMKGLAKGLNLSSFVLKGLLFSADNWQYFLLTLVTRGVASAVIKCLCVTYILRVKKFKPKKIQLNLIYHVIPSMALFFALKAYKFYLQGESPIDDFEL